MLDILLTAGTMLAPMSMMIRAMNVGFAKVAYSGYVLAGICGAGLAAYHNADLVMIQQLCISVVGVVGIYRWRYEDRAKALRREKRERKNV